MQVRCLSGATGEDSPHMVARRQGGEHCLPGPAAEGPHHTTRPRARPMSTLSPALLTYPPGYGPSGTAANPFHLTVTLRLLYLSAPGGGGLPTALQVLQVHPTPRSTGGVHLLAGPAAALHIRLRRFGRVWGGRAPCRVACWVGGGGAGALLP